MNGTSEEGDDMAIWDDRTWPEENQEIIVNMIPRLAGSRFTRFSVVTRLSTFLSLHLPS